MLDIELLQCEVYADTFVYTIFLTVVFIENYMMTSHYNSYDTFFQILIPYRAQPIFS